MPAHPRITIPGALCLVRSQLVHRLTARLQAAWFLRACLGVACALALAAPAAAQQTRAEAIAQQQADKAKDLRPYEPTRPERIVGSIKSRFLEPKPGIYPVMDSVYGGGGFTLGVGFRQFYGDQSTWFARTLYSVKNYKLVELVTVSPGHLGGRMALEGQVGWLDATQVGFYGTGIDTSQDDRANFRLKQWFAGGSARVRPTRWSVVAGALQFEDYTLEPGKGGSPSIETQYTPDTAPGLGANPTYVHSSGTVGLDWRTSPGYTRTGGFYGLTLHDYTDLDDAYSFRRVDAEAIQHVPFMNETWVLSLRGRVQTTVGDDVVPYFLLPSLGSSSTLRAYSSYRFRDRHSVLTQAEWRWFPNRLGFDSALFCDAGKVESRRGDLDLDGLEWDCGIGVRMHGPAATPVRVELAKGSEGWNLVFSGKAAF